MKRSRTFPENRLALFAIGLLTAVLLSGAISPAIAGDEDGSLATSSRSTTKMAMGLTATSTLAPTALPCHRLLSCQM